MKIVNLKTGEVFQAKTKSQALLLATIKHNQIKKTTGQKVRFKVVD